MTTFLYSLLALTLTAHAASNTELLPTEVIVIEQANDKVPKKRGGGSSSIGSDAYDVRTQTTWFYGKKPIITCFNRIESFGQSDDELSTAIEGAIKQWQDYFAAKRISATKSALPPNVNFKLQGKCKGNEDLVIFFGTGPIFSGLSDLKAVQRLNFPVAYVNKTHMSRDLKWSKGYIRIVAPGYYGEGDGKKSPDWKRAGALAAILTHELGHVLGFAHAPGTIMRAELVDQVFADAPLAKLEIDGSKQLVSCSDCNSRYRLHDSPKSKTFFESLGLNLSNGVRLIHSDKTFKISDGAVSLPLRETSRTTISSAQTLWSNFPQDLNGATQAFNLYAYVTNGSSKTPVVLEYNAGAENGDVVLRATDNGELKEMGRFVRD